MTHPKNTHFEQLSAFEIHLIYFFKIIVVISALIWIDWICYHSKKTGEIHHFSDRHQILEFKTNPVEIFRIDYQKCGISLVITTDPAPCQGLSYAEFSYDNFIEMHPNLKNDPAILKAFEEKFLSKTDLLNQNQLLEIKALKEVAAILKKHRLPFWADYGTCLGTYRNQSFIPYDLDIDLSIPQIEFENVYKALQALDQAQYQVLDSSPPEFPQSYLTVYIKSSRTFIDIDTYVFDENKKTITYLYPHQNSSAPSWWKERDKKQIIPFSYDDIFPLRPALFEGIEVLVPNKIREFLQDKYAMSAGGRNGDVSNINPPFYWNPLRCSWDKIGNHSFWIDYPHDDALRF